MQQTSSPLRLLTFQTTRTNRRIKKVTDLATRVMRLETIDTHDARSIDRMVDGFLAIHGDLAAQARTEQRRLEDAHRNLSRLQQKGGR